MVIYERLTGYQNSHYLVRYTTPWTTIFRKNAAMKFFKGDVERVVDISKSDDYPTLRVGFYPHNKGKQLEPIIEKFEDKIRDMIVAEKAAGANRDAFTFKILDDGVELLTLKDFENYYPVTASNSEIFTFLETGEGSFPEVFFVDSTQRKGLQSSWLEVFARSSHMTMKPFGLQTPVGKKFTYMLLASSVAGKFVSEIPDLLNVSMPTSSHEELPSQLNVEAFCKLLESGRIKKLVMMDGKEIVEDSATEETPNESSEEGLDGAEVLATLKSEGVREVNPFGYNLEDSIIESVMKDMPINLTDIINYGVTELFSLIGNLDKVIEVYPDIPHIAKKMCVFQGKVHMVPLYQTFEPDEFFGESIELFVMCSEANYPR